MRTLLPIFVLALCASVPASGQAIRFDSTATTTSAQCVSGKQCPLLVLPGTQINFCQGTPSTVGGCLSSPATTYTSQAASVPCSTTAQLTPGVGGACLSTADAQGGYGAWLLPGSYSYYLRVPVTAGGGTYGPYVLSIHGDSGGYTFDSLYSTLAQACTAAGSGTLAITRAWNATPSQTLACSVWFLGDGKIQTATSASIVFGSGFTCPASQQCLDSSTNSGGSFTWTKSPPSFYPQWWGAKGDNSHEDSTAINAAITAAPNGGIVLLTPGTYRLASAGVSLATGVCIAGSSIGASIINATGSFAAVTVLNAHNACIRSMTIKSAQDGVAVSSTAPSSANDTSNTVIQDVNITSYGDGYAGFHQISTLPVFWTTLYNVNVSNGGVPGTRSCFLFDGTSGYGIRPILIGGIASDCKFGLTSSATDHMIANGVEFDDILASGASGIAIWLKTGTNDAMISPRLEGEGVSAPIDKDWQFDAETFGNQLHLDGGYSGAPSRGTDAGTANCVSGGNGSNGQIATCLSPQIVGSFTVSPGSPLIISANGTFSMPGAVNGQFAAGGAAATTQQLAGVNAVGTMRAPNSNFGVPLALIADSVGRAGYWASQDFNNSTTGTNCALGTPPGIGATPSFSCGQSGVPASAPYLNMGTMGTHITPSPVSSLPACASGTSGTSRPVNDSTSVTFGSNVVGGGGNTIVAFCNGSNWTVH